MEKGHYCVKPPRQEPADCTLIPNSEEIAPDVDLIETIGYASGMSLTMIRITCLGLLAGLLLPAGGCSLVQETNPSFDVGVKEAWAALEEMAADPRKPQRPVLITGGWQGKNLDSVRTYKLAAMALGEENLIVVTYGGINTMSGARTRTIQRVLEAAGPVDANGYTPEVDVIGISMGGTVARDAACPPREDGTDDPHRLKIDTFYGISVPHQGLRLGVLGFYNRMAREMFSDSETNNRIQKYFEPGDYRIEDYGRLGDPWVGVENATVSGQTIRWLPNTGIGQAHLGFKDPRIVADIVKRIRGEEPFSTDPAAPIP
ncbi:MAG: lipase family protein [Planctomycetota bacterium]